MRQSLITLLFVIFDRCGVIFALQANKQISLFAKKKREHFGYQPICSLFLLVIGGILYSAQSVFRCPIVFSTSAEISDFCAP